MPRLPGIALAAAILVAAFPARPARDFVDDAGRRVSLPDRIERVYALFYHREPAAEQVARLLAEPGVSPR